MQIFALTPRAPVPAFLKATTLTPRAPELLEETPSAAESDSSESIIEEEYQLLETSAVVMPDRFRNYRLAVQDGYVYVQCRVKGVMVCVRTHADEVAEAVQQRVLTAFQAAESQLSRASGNLKDAIVFVDAKAHAGALKVKLQCLEIRDFTSAKTLEGFSYVKEAALRVPVPVQVKSGAFFVQTKTLKGYVYFKGGCMRIHSTIEDSVVHIKASGVRTYAAARAEAEAILASVAQGVKRRNAQVLDGLVLAKGKVDNVAVKVRSKAAVSKASVEAALLRCKKAVEELRATKALKNGVTVVSDKVSNVNIYIKEGYLHAVSKAGEKVVYVRAQISVTSHSTKVKILDTYVAAEATVQALLDQLVKKAVAALGVTKASALAVADSAKAKAELLTERSKAFAVEKPITASTASGAALGATGGAVAGLGAGTVAGAAAGLPLALFTFGLSIPVAAVMGGTAGATVGATVGTTAGAVSGGVVGYGYEHRDQINAGLTSAKTKALACKDCVRETAANSRNALAGRFSRRGAAVAA